MLPKGSRAILSAGGGDDEGWSCLCFACGGRLRETVVHDRENHRCDEDADDENQIASGEPA